MDDPLPFHHTPPRWTEDARRRALQLRLEGFSASQIAGQLGPNFTRNMVLGFFFRTAPPLERKIRKTPDDRHHPVPRVDRTSLRPHAPRRRPFGRPVAPAPHFDVVDPTFVPTPETDAYIPVEQRRTLLTLTPLCCRWPVGDVGTPGFFFCGAERMEGAPYCAPHARRAWRS